MYKNAISPNMKSSNGYVFHYEFTSLNTTEGNPIFAILLVNRQSQPYTLIISDNKPAMQKYSTHLASESIHQASAWCNFFFCSIRTRWCGVRQGCEFQVVTNERKALETGSERNLVGATLDTAGLGDDALHVLDLPLAAGEGAELE